MSNLGAGKHLPDGSGWKYHPTIGGEKKNLKRTIMWGHIDEELKQIVPATTVIYVNYSCTNYNGHGCNLLNSKTAYKGHQSSAKNSRSTGLNLKPKQFISARKQTTGCLM